MLIVKIMGPERLPDDDSRKTHTLLTNVTQVRFLNVPVPDSTEQQGLVQLTFGDHREGWAPEEFPVPGNVYVMNEAGRTITTFTGAG